MSGNSTQSAPLAQSTDDDHRAPLYVATLLALVFVVLGVLTRLYVRFKSLGPDDYIILGAFVVGLAQFITIISGLIRGLGQSTDVLSTDKTSSLGQLFLASEALFVISIYVVKWSVLSTIERVLGPDQRTQRTVCWILQGLTAVLALASIIIVVVVCDAPYLLTSSLEDKCPGQSLRWIALAALDSLSETSTFIMFCVFMSGLQMQKRLKTTVTLLLAFRLGCIAFAAVHTNYITAYVDSDDPGTAVVAALVWQQLGLSYSLISALLIALKGFLQSFDIKFGNDQTYAQNSRSGGEKYGMKRLSIRGFPTSAKASQKERQTDTVQSDYQVESTAYSTKIFHGADREGSVRSGISQHPMIRYEKRFEVTHEDKDHSREPSDS